MARLAWPVLVLAVQTLVGVAETYLVSSLGTAAVAGFGLRALLRRWPQWAFRFDR